MMAKGAWPGMRAYSLQGSTAILVLGMHRSGTSAVSGVLHCLGVSLGQTVSGAGPSNPRGYFENTRVVMLHEELLGALGSAWDDPRPLPAGWTEDPGLVGWGERLEEILVAEFAHQPLWGVKDPRLCRLLPWWLPLLAELGVVTRAVLVLRHPLAVAASNAHRTGMPREQALELWLEHTLAAERQTRHLPRAVIGYEALLADWRKAMVAAMPRLQVDWAWGEDQAARVDELLEGELAHHRGDEILSAAEPLAGWARRAWEALLPACQAGGEANTVSLDQLAAERERWAGVGLPVTQYLESQLTRWRERFQHGAREGNGAVADLQAALRENEQRLAGIRAELSRAWEDNRQLAAQRVAQEGELQRLRASLAQIVSTRWFRLASWYWRWCTRLRSGGEAGVR